MHIVWSDKRDNKWEIYYKRSVNNGATWENDKRLTYDSGPYSFPGPAGQPSIAVNGSAVHVVWDDDRDGNYEIYYKYSIDNGNNWSNDIRLTNTSSRSIHPDIAVNGDNVHVIWMENDNIFYINSIDGGKTWSSKVELASTSFFSWCPSIEVNGDNIHVAWRDRYWLWVPELGEKGEILYMRSTNNGRSWDTPIVLTVTYTYGWNTVWKPGLAVNGNNVHIVWGNNNGATDDYDHPYKSDIYYLRSSDNGVTWNDEMRLTYSGDSQSPVVGAYGDFVHIAWGDYIISKDNGSTWSHVIPLSLNFGDLTMAVTEDFAHIVGYSIAPDVGDFTDWREYSIFYRSINVYSPISIILDLNPDTINLNSNNKRVTAYIELPEGYNVNDINISTIKLKPGDVPVDPTAPTTIGDYDSDGISDLMVKFNRANVVANLVAGNEVKLTVTGKLINGTAFEGNDTIRVIK